MSPRVLLWIVLTVLCFCGQQLWAQTPRVPVVIYGEDTNYYWGDKPECRYGKFRYFQVTHGSRVNDPTHPILTYAHSFTTDSVIPIYGLAVAMGEYGFPPMDNRNMNLAGAGFWRKWMEEMHYEMRLSIHTGDLEGPYHLMDSVYFRGRRSLPSGCKCLVS